MAKGYVFRRPWNRLATLRRRRRSIFGDRFAVGASAGLATVSGVGSSVAADGSGAGASAGTSTAAAVSRATAESVGSSDGIGAGSAMSISLAVGASDGVATALAIGRSTAASVGAAAGTSTAKGVTSEVYANVGGVWTLKDSSRFTVRVLGVSVTPLSVYGKFGGTWRLV